MFTCGGCPEKLVIWLHLEMVYLYSSKEGHSSKN